MKDKKKAIIAVGLKIKAFREKEGWSIEDFVKKSGVTGGTISSLERGNQDPKLTSLIYIAETMEITVSELLSDIK